MKIVYGQNEYELKNDLNCAYLKVLLNETKENDRVELTMYEDVFKDLYNKKLKIKKYDTIYLRQALAYFGSDILCNIIFKQIKGKIDKIFEYVENSNCKVYFEFDKKNMKFNYSISNCVLCYDIFCKYILCNCDEIKSLIKIKFSELNYILDIYKNTEIKHFICKILINQNFN